MDKKTKGIVNNTKRSLVNQAIECFKLEYDIISESRRNWHFFELAPDMDRCDHAKAYNTRSGGVVFVVSNYGYKPDAILGMKSYFPLYIYAPGITMTFIRAFESREDLKQFIKDTKEGFKEQAQDILKNFPAEPGSCESETCVSHFISSNKGKIHPFVLKHLSVISEKSVGPYCKKKLKEVTNA